MAGEAITDAVREEIIKELGVLRKSRDPEAAHERADSYLKFVLRSYGEYRIVDAYEAVPMWFA